MRRLSGLITLIVLVACVFSFVQPALAAVYRGTEIKNVSIDSCDGVIRLEWGVVTGQVGPAFGDTEIKIYRIANWEGTYEPTSDRMELVGTFSVPQRPSIAEDDGVIWMTWIDTNVEPGTHYHYRIKTGDVPKRNKLVHKEASDAPKAPPGPEIGGAVNERIKNFDNNVTWFEKMVANIVLALPNWLIDVLGLYDPIELIYMADISNNYRPPGAPSIADPPYLHVFTQAEMEVLAHVYDNLQRYVPISLVVALVLLGLGMLYASANPQAKIGLREYLLGFILAMLILKFGAQLLTIIFDINYAIVKQFYEMIRPVIESLGDDASFLHTMWDPTRISLGGAVMAFIAVFAIAVINFQYIMRKLVIAILIGLLPLVAIIGIAPSKREVLGIWFRELIANVFLQSAHAATLTFLLLFIYHAGDDSQAFWLQLACLLGLATLAMLVRRIIGAETLGSGAMMGGAGAMFGLAALANMGRMLGGGRRIGGMATGIGGAVSGGVAAGGIGGALRQVGGSLAKGAAVGTGMMAGGLVSGAAMGNPALGMAAGAQAGGWAGERAQGVIGPGIEAGVPLSREVGQQASSASQEVFGRNILGPSGGIIAGLRHGKTDASARGLVQERQQALTSAQEQLAEAKANRDYAQATLERMKLQGYDKAGDNMDRISRLSAEKARLAEMEQGISGPQDDYIRQYVDQQRTLVNNELKTLMSEQRQYEAYQGAKQQVVDAKMAHAEAQMRLVNAQKAVSRDSLVNEFKKLKTEGNKSGGGINAPLWR